MKNIEINSDRSDDVLSVCKTIPPTAPPAFAPKPVVIYDYYLLHNTYDEDTIIKNMNHLNKKTVLNTQKLSEEFCAKYIFCIDDIDDGGEDSYLFDLNHIMNRQPHLDEEKLIKCIDDLLS